MNSRKPSRVLSSKLAPPTKEQVAALAHEIWCERGCPEGSDIDIWLEAERQLNGMPPARNHVEADPIPADPAEPDADSDAALNPNIDRQLRGIGEQPEQRSATSL